MKYAVKKIRLHSFKNFRELTYNLNSGHLFGRNSEGKTNLLSSICALVLNQDMDGSRLLPLQEGVQSGWVDVEWIVDGKSVQTYREWRRTDSGFASTGTPPDFNRSEFLLIFNPRYVFEISHGERRDLITDLVYGDSHGNILDEIPEDIEPWVKKIAMEFGKINLLKMRSDIKKYRTELRVLAENKRKYEYQHEIVEDPDQSYELSNNINECKEEICRIQEYIDAIEIIENCLLHNAIEYLNPKMIMTRFTPEGKITFNDWGMDRLSCGEMLECGLDIANMVAGISKSHIPPTVIDDATMYGMSNIDTELYNNLSQIITASYADVDLCEYNNGCLVAVDQSWKVLVKEDFRMDVQIEMKPFQ